MKKIRSKSNEFISTFLYHFFIIIFGFIMIYPLLWMLSSSFKNTNEIFSTTQGLIPHTFKFQNYFNGWKGFGGVSFKIFFKNSFIIAGVSTIGAVVSSGLIAYGFARIKFPFKKFWFMCMMLTLMLPYQVVMIPQFVIFHKLNWVNTFLPLIVPQFFGQSFYIFLIMQFIQGLPKDLDEAAKIDGCGKYTIFFRIILPLIVPALITSGLFSFMWRWDDFFGALLYLNKPQLYPVNLAIKMFADPTTLADWGAMFAMASLSLVPIFVIFIFCQKYLVEGISTTGMKG